MFYNLKYFYNIIKLKNRLKSTPAVLHGLATIDAFDVEAQTRSFDIGICFECRYRRIFGIEALGYRRKYIRYRRFFDIGWFTYTRHRPFLGASISILLYSKSEYILWYRRSISYPISKPNIWASISKIHDANIVIYLYWVFVLQAIQCEIHRLLHSIIKTYYIMYYKIRWYYMMSYDRLMLCPMMSCIESTSIF